MKHLLPILFLLLTNTRSFSQEKLVGFRVGADVASQSFGGLGNNQTDWKFGFIAGASVDHDFENRFHLVSDFMWIMKGTRTRDPATRTTGLTTLNYAEFDLLGKFELSEQNEGLFMTLGPTFGYFLGGRVKNTQDGVETINNKVSGDALDRRFELGGAAGVGFDLNNWVLEFRGQIGFTAIDPAGQTRNAVLAAHFTKYFNMANTPKAATEED
jgi:hypothetical protein